VINPTAVSKVLVLALALASLGLVFAAPGLGVEGTEEGGQAAPAEPETPAEPSQPEATPDQAAPDSSGSGRDSSGGMGQPTQEEQDRFDRYCNQKDAQPSHSDRQVL
jgi:hypothetical protein